MPLVTDNEGLMLMLDEEKLRIANSIEVIDTLKQHFPYFNKSVDVKVFREEMGDDIPDEAFIGIVCDTLSKLEPRYYDPRTMEPAYPARFAVIGRDVYVSRGAFNTSLTVTALHNAFNEWRKRNDPNRTPSDAA